MVVRTAISTKGKSQPKKSLQILGLSLLVIIWMSAGNIACKKKAEEKEAAEEEGMIVKEGINEFAGTVKVAVGKYIFVPKARGFDIVVQGVDTSALTGREIKGEGEFSSERPSILVANTIDIKNDEGNWENVYTRSEEVVLDDYIDLSEREKFEELKGISYDKKIGWEGKEKVKVYGKWEASAGSGEGEQKEANKIVVFDDKDREVGTIIVDKFSDYAVYYMKKLRLFDKFYFYLTVKDTVDWTIRQRTRELFHADVHFAGLF